MYTVFEHCLVLRFFSYFLWVLEARSKLILFCTKIWVNRARIFASTCTSLLCSKPVQRNYRHFPWDFKPKNGFYGLIKVRLLVKTNLMEIILGLKVTMDQVKTKKFCFVYFCRFLTLRPWNTYIYGFRALFGFCSFLATSCGFWKLGVSLFSSTLSFE